MKSNIQTDDWEYNPQLKQFECRICHTIFDSREITAWEIHKLNHTLVSLRNIIDRASQGRLY